MQYRIRCISHHQCSKVDCSTTKRVPIPNETSSESSRRDVSKADRFGVDTIPTVEMSRMENRIRGVLTYTVVNVQLYLITKHETVVFPWTRTAVAITKYTRSPLRRLRDSDNSVTATARQLPSTATGHHHTCLLYTSPSPRDGLLSRMPSSA